MASKASQDFLGGADATILGFLKDRDGAQVGVREIDAAEWTSEALAICGENRSDSWPHHGVAYAHDIDSRDALTNVTVHSLEVVQDRILPVIPILRK